MQSNHQSNCINESLAIFLEDIISKKNFSRYNCVWAKEAFKRTLEIQNMRAWQRWQKEESRYCKLEQQ